MGPDVDLAIRSWFRKHRVGEGVGLAAHMKLKGVHRLGRQGGVQHQSQVTWDQKLLFHPHLHVVVPDAGFDVGNGEWRIRG